MSNTETIVLGGGCFWCTESVFKEVRGVLDVESGYSNGQETAPTYEQVCTGRTGCNEVVKLVYDPAVIGTRQILEIFFATHDPTQLNRQGNDVGTQYRSAVYWTTPEQEEVVRRTHAVFQERLRERSFSDITTELRPAADAGPFYYAEEHHQQYLHKVPNGYCPVHATGVRCG